MNKKEQHIRDLLQRWTTGEITAREEAELLTAAQQDLFLQEALAAYQGQADHDHAARLDRIRSKTSQRQPIVRMIGRWTAIAASVLLLVTVSWWTLREEGFSDMASPVAMEESATAPSSPKISEDQAAESPAFTEAEELSTAEPIAQSSPLKEATTPKDSQEDKLLSRKDESQIAADATRPPATYNSETNLGAGATSDEVLAGRAEEDTFSSRTLPVDSEAIVLETREAVEADELSPPPAPRMAAPATSPTYPAQNQAYARQDEPTRISNSGIPVPATGYRIIEGYVTDAEGFPLIGASIVTPGAANGTVTDLDGFYRITVANEIKTLSISYTGFASTQVNVDDENQLDVTLAEAVALDEVVVTGYAAKKRGQAEASTGTAQPIKGFRALRDYVVANTPDNTPRARIKLRFLVQADGSLTDFEVLKSTNVGQNSLAIQLLEQGPKWEVTEGSTPVETVYVVRF
ncbi:carboxypeptidase-like regulatory domain-containing protein [Lewinella cohaerens]|uniref:carboxypeptidase-like regulatory domain-containing protein n=1 Tax=Lewinella cohaerens TaxID=70995 RepID=UPI00037E45FB|nr:carboxypeptidase-like regulatory domain-containing protein [Lewinella cohaerens]